MHDAFPAAAAPDLLARAAAHIEAHLFEPLTVSELAGVAGLSPYHFSRQFTARFGESAMAFVRARRLAAAAQMLLAPDPAPLVELAFACGFESQEGFTRAFTRAFGVSPGRFRRGGATLMEHVMENPTGQRADLTMQAAPVSKPALRIVGLTRVFDQSSVHGIPALWDEFNQKVGYDSPLFAKGTFGVCASGGEQGALKYTAGVPLPSGAPVPEDLDLVELAPRPYLVFRQQLDGSNLHQQMQAAVKEIWGVRIPALNLKLAQAPDLEVYPEDFAPEKPGWVEWWIPVDA